MRKAIIYLRGAERHRVKWQGWLIRREFWMPTHLDEIFAITVCAPPSCEGVGKRL